jgi:hypothetical protein
MSSGIWFKFTLGCWWLKPLGVCRYGKAEAAALRT